jgi:hypothetical protein
MQNETADDKSRKILNEVFEAGLLYYYSISLKGLRKKNS